MFRQDPGPCGVCGAEHSACTASSGPITIQQTPARDALLAAAQERESPAELQLPVASDPPDPLTFAEVVQAGLPPGQFTSGTYRGKKKR